jgi:hypothetical protein
LLRQGDGRHIHTWHHFALFANEGSVLSSCVDVSFNGLKAVDIFNSTSGTWNTANLSAPRGHLAATSLQNFGIALFAGGCLSRTLLFCCCRELYLQFLFTSQLVFVFCHGGPGKGCSMCLSVRVNSWNSFLIFLDCAANNGGLCGTSNVVDIYNASSGTWSTAVLSRARYYLAATSLQNLAFFAGGYASA